ncbi:hypothetical protein ABNX05_11165 [Lysinibacillus sp. M3]|uniref:Uncharacterized protein n=1 Tax=Lysinibacillus zambalensis TaxID=3160866 RepID=A0ABV1MRP0_9BACI
MTNVNLFEKAVKGKYRFQFKGIITVEDLWDLSVQNLDSIFKSLNTELKQVSEESLLQTKSSADEELENKIAIIKYIVEVKVREANKKTQEKAQREQREKILEIIEAKQNQDLQDKTIEELQAMLDNQ